MKKKMKGLCSFCYSSNVIVSLDEETAGTICEDCEK